MLKQWSRATAVLIAATALSACGGAGDDAAGKTTEPPTSQQASGMEGTPGMQNQGGGAAEQMQAHMRMMQGASGERMKEMLPEHRQMAANMIAGFIREMKGMNMATDAGWNATVDFLRQDLVRMPEMAPSELQAFMPAHEARLNRLMASHRSMMGNMKM